MTERPAPAGPCAREQPPAGRPTWMVVLSVLTLIYGGLALFSGLGSLRRPSGSGWLDGQDELALGGDQQALLRQIADAGEKVMDAHRGAVRAQAAASVALALLLLYAAAAALSLDRHGRRIALAAAWGGIVYQGVRLWIALPLVRAQAAATAPLMAKLMAAGNGRAAQGSPEDMAKIMQAVVVISPIVVAAIGVGFSLLLFAYFGGRKGRALYGLDGDGR